MTCEEEKKQHAKQELCRDCGAAGLFPWWFDEEDERCAALKLLILNRLSYMQAEGVTRFYIPIDPGIGLYASEVVVSLMENDKELQLYSLIPYENQAVKWSPELRNRYYAVQEQCTEPILISGERTPTCELDAMLEAIDRADHVLAVGARDQPQDGKYAAALRYDQRSGRGIQRISAPELFLKPYEFWMLIPDLYIGIM